MKVNQSSLVNPGGLNLTWIEDNCFIPMRNWGDTLSGSHDQSSKFHQFNRQIYRNTLNGYYPVIEGYVDDSVPIDMSINNLDIREHYGV